MHSTRFPKLLFFAFGLCFLFFSTVTVVYAGSDAGEGGGAYWSCTNANQCESQSCSWIDDPSGPGGHYNCPPSSCSSDSDCESNNEDDCIVFCDDNSNDPEYYDLALVVTKSGSGTGRVTGEDTWCSNNDCGGITTDHINCGSDCVGSLTTRSFTRHWIVHANAASGSEFVEWSRSEFTYAGSDPRFSGERFCGDETQCIVRVANTTETIDATFRELPINKLTVKSVVAGPMEDEGATITHIDLTAWFPFPSIGYTNYTVKDTSLIYVRLSAPSTHNYGSFDRWEGCDSKSDNQCLVTVSGGNSQTPTAYYTRPPQNRIIIKSRVNGSYINGVEMEHVSGEVLSGYITEVDEDLHRSFTTEFRAPDSYGGADFTGWSGCDSESGRNCTVSISGGAQSVAATFESPLSVNLKVQNASENSAYDTSGITIDYGDDVRLDWSVDYATSCSASGGWNGNKTPSEGQEFIGNLTSSTTYTLTCTGSSSSKSDTVTVTVDPATMPQPVEDVTLTPYVNGEETYWVRPGTDVELRWSSLNATSCTLSGQDDTLPVIGSSTGSHFPVTVEEATRYEVECRNDAGDSETAETTVWVLPVYTEF